MKETEKGATISHCGNYRYALWRVWDTSSARLVFVMLNPSKADAVNDDATIRRCVGFARSWGYGSIYVYNMFAYRATDPKELVSAPMRGIDIIGPENDAHLSDVANMGATVILAWGDHAYGYPGRIRTLKSMLPSGLCLKITKKGMPNHPLYVRRDAVPFPYKWPRR